MQRLALFSFAAIACLPSESRAQALDTLPGIESDLSFIETQVGATLTSLGSPASGYPVYGGNTGTWTTVSPSDPGMDERVSSGDRFEDVAQRGEHMDDPAGIAGLDGPAGRSH
jgi:hypothetical protein